MPLLVHKLKMVSILYRLLGLSEPTPLPTCKTYYDFRWHIAHRDIAISHKNKVIYIAGAQNVLLVNKDNDMKNAEQVEK